MSTHEPERDGSDSRSLATGASRWAALLLGLFSIWAFIFLLAPWAERFGPIEDVCSAVRESGIDAGAYYYTDVEECAQAERLLRNSLDR